jgi:hypothetical protein
MTIEWTVDQTQHPGVPSAFRTIGTVQLEKNAQENIRICNVGTDAFVILDAIQLVLQP